VVEAGDLAERFIRERGPTAEAIELLGCLRLASGDRTGAWEWFRRLVYLEPTHESGLMHLALLSEGEGDAAAAQRYRGRARRAAEATAAKPMDPPR
jgi:chemotaxis protein methyltransferase WspC